MTSPCIPIPIHFSWVHLADEPRYIVIAQDATSQLVLFREVRVTVCSAAVLLKRVQLR